MPKKKKPTVVAAPAAAYEYIPIEDLRLDDENPRLADISIDANPSQETLAVRLWQEMSVNELALSIAHNGYFPHEPLFVEKNGETWTVLEGNRRFAAVMVLTNSKLRKKLKIGEELPTLSSQEKANLEELPCVVTTRRNSWQYLGFRHINGPATWGSYAKAQYIARIRNEYGIPLDEIAKHIGDFHSTVARQYHGLMVIEQAEKSGVFDRSDIAKEHFSFSHMYTGLAYPGIQKFLAIESVSRESRTPVPTKHLKQLGELCTWLYGKSSKSIEPVVKSQNPDLRTLDEVLQSDDATEALRSGIPLRVAHDVSLGDDRIFRRALHDAKEALQKASATVVTGFGPDDVVLIKMANDVVEIADDLVDQMNKKLLSSKRNKKGPSRVVGP